MAKVFDEKGEVRHILTKDTLTSGESIGGQHSYAMDKNDS